MWASLNVSLSTCYRFSPAACSGLQATPGRLGLTSAPEDRHPPLRPCAPSGYRITPGPLRPALRRWFRRLSPLPPSVVLNLSVPPARGAGLTTMLSVRSGRNRSATYSVCTLPLTVQVSVRTPWLPPTNTRLLHITVQVRPPFPPTHLWVDLGSVSGTSPTAAPRETLPVSGRSDILPRGVLSARRPYCIRHAGSSAAGSVSRQPLLVRLSSASRPPSPCVGTLRNLKPIQVSEPAETAHRFI